LNALDSDDFHFVNIERSARSGMLQKVRRSKYRHDCAIGKRNPFDLIHRRTF
jgi:hypothetical protein